ncbi:MAG: ATP-binding protein [Deltaproteobacteria bacterium]|nr:ATP-binding protein [Deltaproteobacteria bacterium]
MHFRAQTELISAFLALSIVAGVLLRERKRRLHWLFAAFAGSVGLWFLALFLKDRFVGVPLWSYLASVAIVLLPQAGVRSLRAFLGETAGRPSGLYPWVTTLGVLMMALALSPFHAVTAARVTLSAYVIGLFSAVAIECYRESQRAPSRIERARAVYLVGVSVATTAVFFTDLLPFVGIDMGPVGSTLVLVVLFMLSQAMERSRLVDLYEITSRLVVLTALAFVLAGVYYLLVDWARGQAPYILNAIVASLVILIPFDPLREKMESQVARFFFRERFDLETEITALRRRLANVLELDELGRELIDGLSASRRVTHASLFLSDAVQRGLECFVHLGTQEPQRIENVSARLLIERMSRDGSVVAEQLVREAIDARERGEIREGVELQEAAEQLQRANASVAIPIVDAQGRLSGALFVGDDRIQEPFSSEEVQILRDLGAQIAIVLENTQGHERIKERDRLAAMGEMAAGLAHEIRNPLGSIKAAVQLLQPDAKAGSVEAEYLGIIGEEVDRLNRVVGGFLDYARPGRAAAEVIDIAETTQRTLSIIEKDLPAEVELVFEAEPDLPPVRMDPSHVRQVLLNLVRNAIEAMESRGRVSIVVQRRLASAPMIEIVVRDSGPGIDARLVPKLFTPFVTTKASGTGLGLALSQRFVASAGGRIELRTQSGRGTTFVVVLPAHDTGRSSLVPMQVATPR